MDSLSHYRAERRTAEAQLLRSSASLPPPPSPLFPLPDLMMDKLNGSHTTGPSGPQAGVCALVSVRFPGGRSESGVPVVAVRPELARVPRHQNQTDQIPNRV